MKLGPLEYLMYLDFVKLFVNDVIKERGLLIDASVVCSILREFELVE